MPTDVSTGPEGGRNLFPYEPQIRALLGVGLGAGGAAAAASLPATPMAWGMAVMVVAMGAGFALAAAHQRCPVYAALGINDETARRNTFLALMPEHNPAPVLAFDRAGTVRFRNGPAETCFGEAQRLDAVFGDAPGDTGPVIDRGENFSATREMDGRTWQLYARGVPEHDVLLTYAFDVTDVVALQREMIATQREIIHRMGEIAETRSEETGNHVKRVAAYSRLLAELAGLDAESARTLEAASPMHDIGKVGIPDRVLNKPGRLDAEEWAIMKTHAEIGHNVLAHSDRPLLRAAATVAGEHHEKWDGSGYPKGLSGTEIHIHGRITALADVFDALGSDRVYKSAWSLDAILALLRDQRGRQFDPQLVDLFLDNLDSFLEIRDQYADPV